MMLGRSLDEFTGIRPKVWYPFFSSGNWSLHQLIDKLVAVIGPCHATIVSYTISEEPLRAIWNMVRSERIFSFSLLVDQSAFRHKKDLLLFASKIPGGDIRTGRIHAKLAILQNEFWKVCVITSANMTPNARCESGVVCTDPNVVREYIKEVADLMKKSATLKFNA